MDNFGELVGQYTSTTGTLQEFVGEFVHSGEETDFIVKEDLLSSYTNWRQLKEPIMQISDLEAAESDVDNILPNAHWRNCLVVEKDGQRGSVTDCWQGWVLTWPGGNRTEPTLITPVTKSTGVTAMYDPAAKYAIYDPAAQYSSLVNVANSNQKDSQSIRQVHACLHYDFEKGYEPGELKHYLESRCTNTSPDDIEELEEAIVAAVKEIKRENVACAKWKVRHVHHEGIIINVFVGNLKETRENSGWLQEKKSFVFDPTPIAANPHHAVGGDGDDDDVLLPA